MSSRGDNLTLPRRDHPPIRYILLPNSASWRAYNSQTQPRATRRSRAELTWRHGRRLVTPVTGERYGPRALQFLSWRARGGRGATRRQQSEQRIAKPCVYHRRQPPSPLQIQCDGASPQCSGCKNHALPCTYNRETGVKKRAAKPGGSTKR